jgi:hypothetical protein
MFKVGKNQFYWVFCQDISVTFIFTVVFKVDTLSLYLINQDLSVKNTVRYN